MTVLDIVSAVADLVGSSGLMPIVFAGTIIGGAMYMIRRAYRATR